MKNGKYYKLEFQNVSKTVSYKNLNTVDKKCLLQRIVNIGNKSSLNHQKRKAYEQYLLTLITYKYYTF